MRSRIRSPVGCEETFMPRVFERSLVLPSPLQEVFAFFADPRNLEELTPPWLSFRILREPPIPLEEGTTIDYALRVRGLPLRWRSRITTWNPPHEFVDEQVRGPYRQWVHSHTFEGVEGGTRVGDRVLYRVLGGPLVDRLLVRRDVERIFDFRSRALALRFGSVVDALTPR